MRLQNAARSSKLESHFFLCDLSFSSVSLCFLGEGFLGKYPYLLYFSPFPSNNFFPVRKNFFPCRQKNTPCECPLSLHAPAYIYNKVYIPLPIPLVFSAFFLFLCYKTYFLVLISSSFLVIFTIFLKNIREKFL